jgi:RES domain-containing protein
MPNPHSSFPQLFQSIMGGALLTPWAGPIFRSAAVKFMSHPYRMTGLGAALMGGRWNVLNLMPANYFSLDLVTLAAEVNARLARYQFRPVSFQPHVTAGFTASLQAVLDLTNPAVLNALGLTSAGLTACPWLAIQNSGHEALTQACARAAFENTAEALLAPSAQNVGGKNLIVFPSNVRAGSSVAAMNASQIPFVHGLP